MAVATDIAAAMDTDADTDMAAGDSDLDSVSAIPTMAAITAIRTAMGIHLTAAVTIQTRTTAILTRMARILTATHLNSTPRNSSINTGHRRSNSSNTVRNMAHRSSNNNSIGRDLLRLSRRRRNRIPRRRPTALPDLRRRPTTATTSRTASGIALAIPVLSSGKYHL